MSANNDALRNALIDVVTDYNYLLTLVADRQNLHGWLRMRIGVLNATLLAADKADGEATGLPFGSERKTAMAIYTPPFRFKLGYIFDSNNHMVADQGGPGEKNTVEGAVAAQVRGWGRIGYMLKAAAIQDEIGHMMAEALNEYYRRATPSKQDTTLNDAVALLREVSRCYTREDDLPDNLLPRIDAFCEDAEAP